MEHLTDKIQDYIEGQLFGEELEAFEQHLKDDAEFRNLVTLQREVHQILNSRLNSSSEKLTDLLKAEELRYRNQHAIRFKRIRIWGASVAAACALIAGFLFMFKQEADYYALPVMSSEVVRGNTLNVSYENAVKLFNEKSYQDARLVLSALTESDSTQVQWKYYEALTYLGEENWSKGFDALDPIAKGYSVFANDAKFYQAVALIKNNDRGKALEILNQIDDNGALGEKRDKLIEELK